MGQHENSRKGNAVQTAMSMLKKGIGFDECVEFVKEKYPELDAIEIVLRAQKNNKNHNKNQLSIPSVKEIEQTRLRPAEESSRIFVINEGNFKAKLQLYNGHNNLDHKTEAEYEKTIEELRGLVELYRSDAEKYRKLKSLL